MTSTVDQLEQQLKNAFTGGAAPKQGDYTAVHADAPSLAANLLYAYQNGLAANPTKAPAKGKGILPPKVVIDAQMAVSKGFWDDVWSVVEEAAPIIVNSFFKDFQQPPPTLQSVYAKVPDARKQDPEFAAYASKLVVTLAQGTVQAASGTKDFKNNQPPIPTAPAGKDKAWWDDVWSFVQEAVPVALPIVMSLI